MNATLNLTNVQLADDGSMFRCVATGNVTSDTAKLTVNAVPTILTQPSDQTVLAGQTAAFSVAASDGTTPYSYQWQVNTGGGFTDISGATSATYTTTATTLAMGGYQYRCVVTDTSLVTATSTAATLTVNPISVTGVSLNKSTLALTAGSTKTLVATVLPKNATNQAVTWTSDNKRVAAVDRSGTVKASAAGTANITVTTADGKYTATCKVRVTIKVTGVTLDKTTASVTVGNTLQLTASVLPTDATDKGISWVSGDTSVATVDANGLVTARKAGTATITAITDDGGYSAACTVTVRDASAPPQVGDNGHRMLWLITGLASMLLLLGLLVWRQGGRTVLSKVRLLNRPHSSNNSNDSNSSDKGKR